ncbi:MAG: hypothetical protein ACPG19_07340, partial [Saprospiraceae bacterium]
MSKKLHSYNKLSHNSSKISFFLSQEKLHNYISPLYLSVKTPLPNYKKMNSIITTHSLFSQLLRKPILKRLLPLLGIFLLTAVTVEAQYSKDYASHWGGTSFD